MSYSASLVLVLLAVILLVAGLVADSTMAFTFAIFLSGVAVVLLGRRRKPNRSPTFVSNAPPRAMPRWAVVNTEDGRASVDVRDLPVELEIDHVIDNYRRLLTAEVLPLLETLSTDELRKVVFVEQQGRNRAAILQRAQRLIDKGRVSS